MTCCSSRFVRRLALANVLFALGCDAPSPRGNSGDRSPLQREVAGMWTDADIGTDAKYQQVIRGDVPAQAIAPVDMREVTASLAGGRSLRNWPNQLKFACEDQRIRVSWAGEIANQFDSKEALERFDTAMNERGYRVLVGDKAVEELGNRMGLSAKEIDAWAHSQQYQGYTRKVGQTEIAGLAEAMNYAGARGVASGIRFQWHAVRPYAHPQPTLAEALAALPSWFRVSHIQPAFYEALSNQKITECGGGHQLSILFTSNVYDMLVKSLEAEGFEYYREDEPRNGQITTTWHRSTDETFAHVTTYPDSQRVRFYCQPPQHKGPPKSNKPLALHPSQRLPASKRSVLKLGQLTFADEQLKQQTQFFQDMADGIAEDGWFVQRFKDTRYSAAPQYVASWETTHVEGSPYARSVRPYRAIHIALDGPAAANADEQLVSLNVRGRWVPKEGWAAMVNYSPAAECWAWVGLVPHQYAQFSFDGSSSCPVIRLTRNFVSAIAHKDSAYTYEYTAHLPYDPAPRAIAERRERFIELFDSPEKLRDAVLADIEQLGRIAADQIARSEGIKVMDHSQVRSDSPPRAVPFPNTPISDVTQKLLLNEVLGKLDSQQKLVRENYQEMHAALMKALPLDKSELP